MSLAERTGRLDGLIAPDVLPPLVCHEKQDVRTRVLLLPGRVGEESRANVTNGETREVHQQTTLTSKQAPTASRGR